MGNRNPIGIFDSGIGGTSIASEIHKLLPNEDLIYLADSKNAPYGTKAKDTIIELAHKNTKKLLDFQAKLIVVACNTATTNAIKTLRKTYSVPFIGIEPAIKPATLETKSKKIGVLATRGTLGSSLFAETSKKFVHNDLQLVQVEGNAIVEAIEANEHTSTEFIDHLRCQLQLFIDEEVDCLVLGCTHYPYISPLIQQILPTVKIIDAGFAVANQTKNVLINNLMLSHSTSNGKVSIYSNAEDLAPITTLTKEKFGNLLRFEYLDF